MTTTTSFPRLWPKPSWTRCMAAFSSSLTVFISYFIMSFYEDTSQNAQYSYECHRSVPPLSSSTHSTPSTLMPLTMPLLRSSLGGNEYIFVFADEISNPRCFFLLQRRFVQEASSVLMSPMPSHLQASAMASGSFACLCSWILCVWLLRPASLTRGMDRQTHERLWIAGVTDHRADSLDNPGSMFRLLYMSPQTYGNTYYEEPTMTCVL